jgi:Lon protease-like protein
MNKKDILPKKIPIFPLSNFIIFPETTVPLNIFEPRYIKMISDSLNGSKMIGMIQPKKSYNKGVPELYSIGCIGKIESFQETKDGRYMIILNGLSRFKVLDEIKNNKIYRECEVSFNDFKNDVGNLKKEMEFSNLKLILKDIKILFKKKGFEINWNEIEKQSVNQTINTLSMASPFSIEEKQALLETEDLDLRKKKLEEILVTYVMDNFSNTTLQ